MNKINPNDSVTQISNPNGGQYGLTKREKLIFDLYVKFASYTSDTENKGHVAPWAIETADILLAEMNRATEAIAPTKPTAEGV